MEKTKIDWADSTWNPVTGCLHGCEYCYAYKIATRFGGLAPDNKNHELEKLNRTTKGNADPYPFGFAPTLHRYKIAEPNKWKKPRNIFVCSMADLFGKWVTDSWLNEVFEGCRKAPQHNYLFLTKNPQKYITYNVPCGKNMWYGTSITKLRDMWNYELLPSGRNKFVSIEPILEDLEVGKFKDMFRKIKWCIIGAETGNRKNKVVPKRKWIEDIVEECKKNDVPIFMKSSLKDVWGEELITEFPEQLQKGINNAETIKKHSQGKGD